MQATAKLHIPNNITPIFFPSRAPELNPVENIWQYLGSNWLSNRVFDTYDAITPASLSHFSMRATFNDGAQRWAFAAVR